MNALGDVVERSSQRLAAAAREVAAFGGSPRSSSRIAHGFTQCLQRFEESAQSASALAFSHLNADGSPIEFAFSNSDAKLRYTTEVAGPEVDVRARIAAAVELCRIFGAIVPPPETVETWRSFQTGGPLRWGVWLGVCQGESVDRLKLYLEVPSGNRAPAVFEGYRLTPESQLIMLGYDCATGEYEYYFRQPPMHDNSAVEGLRQRHFQSERRAAVLDAFAQLCGLPALSALRWVNFGYSFAENASSEEAFTLFVRSRSVGNAARVRTFFLKHERSAAEGASAYRNLLGSVATADLPDHGTVGLRAMHDGRLEIRVGLSGAVVARLCNMR